MSRPNIVLICVEHWAGARLGSAGHPTVMTPTLDELADNGVRFTNAYSATPTCIPARRSLMTGTTARTHGDRIFNETLEMPPVPSLAGTFSDAGYQTYSVGKLHVYPQRDRIGFDDAILNEEGRHHLGLGADDYELFLASKGYAGQEFTHGMGTNNHITRPWHLPEDCHPTNWATMEMCRAIKRRDPKRPAFWYLSYIGAHPPLTPLQCYIDMYKDAEVDMPYVGKWAQDEESLPYALRVWHTRWGRYGKHAVRLARQAHYAMCTHIDHQIRLVIGTLREEGLLDNTIIIFTADHGDMLGDHGICNKGVFYESSANIPMILVPVADQYERVGHHQTDERLVELMDVMPTLLDLAGVPIPETVEGTSLAGNHRRDYLYGEHYEDGRATRMVHDGRYKLIYYAIGNRTQLFDLKNNPNEIHDLSGTPDTREIEKRLKDLLIENLYGSDLEWLKNDCLEGLPAKEYHPGPNRGLSNQRGWRFM